MERVEGIDLDDGADILSYLDDIGDDRDDWRDVGMAIKHQFGEEGWEIFDSWSRERNNYHKRENLAQWRSFKQDHANPITFRTLMKRARERGWQAGRLTITECHELFDEMDSEEMAGEEVHTAPTPEHDGIRDEFEDLPQAKSTMPEIPDKYAHLCRVPGKLGLLQDYYRKTAIMDQPLMGLAAALAYGSVICGRNYTTDHRNYSMLYVLVVAGTGAGKEYGVQVVAKVLREASLDHLLGPKKFSSEPGLHSSLLMKPNQIVLVDEIGRSMGISRASGDAAQENVQTGLMEVYGRADGVYSPTGYSTKGLKKEEVEALEKRYVVRPSITLLAATTEVTGYKALTIDDIQDGWLNRILMMRTNYEPENANKPRNIGVPKDLIKWSRRVAIPDDPDGMEDILQQIDPTTARKPILIPFHPACEETLHALYERQQQLVRSDDDVGLVFKRVREMAMRVALIVALSKEEDFISPPSLKWALDFVFFFMQEAAKEYKRKIGMSDAEGVAQRAAAVVIKAGRKGITAGQLANDCRPYQRLREGPALNDVLMRMRREHGVHKVNFKPNRGPSSDRFFHERWLKESSGK